MIFATLRGFLPRINDVGDRGQRRIFRAGLTGLSTLVSKAITVGLSLLTLPLTSYYLGKERYGIWLTLSSFVIWFAVADFGLNISLINALSGADGKDDRSIARQSVAGALWMTIAIGVIIIAICLSVVPFVNWASIFNLQTAVAIDEIGPAVMIVLIFCVLRLPASIISSIYLSYQEGYIYQCWNALSGLFGIAGLILAIEFRAGLPWLAAGFLGNMLVADVLSAIYLFGWHKRWLIPSPRFFNMSRARWLLKRGAQFWVAHISSMLMLQTDLFIIAWMFGAGEVAVYGTTLRLFTLIGATQAAFTFPLWSAYGEASARKDHRWLEQTFKQSIKISLIWAVTGSLLMLVMTPMLFKILVASEVTPHWHLSIAVMAIEIVNAIARCVVSLLNGLGAVKSQAIFGPVGGLANLVLSWALGMRFGLPGVAWATVICLAVFWVGIIGWDAVRRLRRLVTA